MELLWYIMALSVLLGLYYWLKKKSAAANREYVQCVEAGPMDEVDAETLKKLSFYDRQIVVRDDNGKVLGNDRYARIVVNGDCMTERGIYNGNQLLAEKIIADSTNLQNVLKKDNIVWLYIDETKIDKIRVFDAWENDEMKTYYFKNGNKHYSSHNHKPSQVKGIVRYKI